MSNSQTNALVVVEGKRTEPGFFRHLAKEFALSCEVFQVRSNIYNLFRQLREDDFNTDTLALLREMAAAQEEREILSRKFAYIYLVYDCDLQHTPPPQAFPNGVLPNRQEIINDNIDILRQMTERFIDETTIGKLYVNFPMMESFKDCDSFFDISYANNSVSRQTILDRKYKELVGIRKLANFRIDQYSKEQFSSLARQNVFKLNLVSGNSWSAPVYDQFRDISSANKILENELAAFLSSSELPVLNTSLFLPLDYFGNKNGFYDSVVGFSDNGSDS